MSDAFERLHGYYFEDLEVGMSASLGKAFSEDDVAAFAALSLDDNPLHMSEAFAARARTRGRVVHGMVTASLVSALIGTRLPGPGCLWMAQETRFLEPVRIGDHVRAFAEVSALDNARQRARLETLCRVADAVVLAGHALVWVPARKGN